MQNVASVFLTLLKEPYKKWHMFSVKSDSKALSLNVSRNLVQGSVPSQSSAKPQGFLKPGPARPLSGTQASSSPQMSYTDAVFFEISGGISEAVAQRKAFVSHVRGPGPHL